MLDKLFTGKKPPDEINVIDRLNESKILKSRIFKMTKIPNVNKIYKINIFEDCFKVSDTLNDKKFVKDFFKLLSKISINKIIENKKYKFEIISEHKGDEAGIKSCTLKITGSYIYGWLKSESGVHRLVRISPFDSGARRHTSFASVWIYPVVDENIDIEIIEKDLRIDTYRSSGAGGQHVNTTDSAVRITHIPTKIVVQCQNERSQHKNKDTCMNMLRARLYNYELKKREDKTKNIENSKSDIGWGHQIRSYVLHPYRLVKDNRTNCESSNPDKVLDGEINEFLESSLYKS